MSQIFAVWLVIGLSLITANLPFVVERPFLMLPWRIRGEPDRPLWSNGLAAILFFGLLLGLAYMAFVLIGGAFFMASDLASVTLFMGKLVGVLVVAAGLLALPGWRNRRHVVHKSFIVRLLEVLVFYGLIGVLGFAFEVNMGNRFEQGWEFYAITLSLFLVLGYPGFVYRYLLRRPKRKAP